jgi:hypothetical protein
MRIKIIYNGHNEDLDKRITSALNNAGFTWYGQGFDIRTQERDIVFDVDPPLKPRPINTHNDRKELKMNYEEALEWLKGKRGSVP